MPYLWYWLNFIATNLFEILKRKHSSDLLVPWYDRFFNLKPKTILLKFHEDFNFI